MTNNQVTLTSNNQHVCSFATPQDALNYAMTASQDSESYAAANWNVIPTPQEVLNDES